MARGHICLTDSPLLVHHLDYLEGAERLPMGITRPRLKAVPAPRKKTRRRLR